LNYAGKFDAKLPADGASPYSNGHGHVETITQQATHAPAGAIIVADSQLLFNGDYKRSGVDLILSKDDQKLVLHDYFKGEKQAPLSSPDGAHLTGDIVNALTGHTQYAQADGSASANHVIGHVTKLIGSATVIRNGVSVILNNGDNVEKGDVVTSGANSTLGITFIDGTVFGLSSNARMVLNEMVYDPNGSNNSSLLSLVAGTITFVAGETAKHGDMKVDTPVATMGIRGTAVLSILAEIDFNVPIQNQGPPTGIFQVLVEPDGTTGSYILFDKTTLAPIATVNQAGQQININNGLLSITNSPLSDDVQKLINDVFSLKFTDANPKTFEHFTDIGVPQQLQSIVLASGATAIPFIINTIVPDKLVSSNTSDPTGSFHISVPPTVVAFGNTFIAGAGTKGGSAIDAASGTISFVDINPGDRPTVKVTFSSFTFQDSHHNDVTSSLTAQQQAEIAAVEAALTLTPSPNNNNNGSVSWTYSIADSAFGFLAPGEILTLTYVAEVDTNYAPLNTAVFTPITITITGLVLPTIATTSGAFTELPGTDNSTIDHTAGTITFTDVDPTARPVVSTQFTSFTYQDVFHHDITSSLSAQQLADIAAIEASLTLTPSATNANNGSVGWSYDVVNSKFNFLGAGDTLTLTYTAAVNDGHGGLVTQPFTVTITGTDDPPTIAATSGAFTELPETSNSTIDHTGGTITFTDVNLTDRPVVSTQFASFTDQDGSHHDITSSLSAQQLADIAAVEASLTLTPSATNANNGSVAWSYDVVNSKFNFLRANDTLTLTYSATVDDGHGGLVTQPFTVTITGTNDAPTIQGETDPSTQAIVAVNHSGVPTINQGVNANSFGLNTETFDSQTTGSLSNNGAGHGNFFSAALDATFSGSGDAGVVNGSLLNITGAPFVGPFPGSADTTNYLSVGAFATETIIFATEENVLGLYWGSVDPNNTIDFYNGTTLVAHYTGNDISPLFSDGNLGSFASNGYVEFTGLAPFNKVVFGTGSINAFEIDNISAGSVHAQLASPIAGTLTVSEPNIGDTLTASVTGNATIEYNGSTTLPTGVDVSALTAASDIKFDSVTSNGGTEVLNWTYDPINPNLDFLKAGDTLTISYTAQVNDGFGNAGSQPLTVTIVGAGSSANMSNFQVVSGTTQNDTFNNVGNGVTIFGGGGQDTFVFNAGFKSATIADFDVNKDAINISHTLFSSVSALLASAQPIDSGHDTLVTDAAHDTIKLVGVTVAQIQSHPSDFHLV
jgi:VCBS repeat-containing protein